MNRPPRAVDRPILTGFGIWRVIFVGLSLLAVTLWAFFWMKSHGASDQLARTVAVNMITIGQVFYLLNSRYLLDSSLSLRAHLGNKYLPLGIGAVVVLQLFLPTRRHCNDCSITKPSRFGFGRGSSWADWRSSWSLRRRSSSSDRRAPCGAPLPRWKLGRERKGVIARTLQPRDGEFISATPHMAWRRG
jgi:hypothetical protein